MLHQALHLPFNLQGESGVFHTGVQAREAEALTTAHTRALHNNIPGPPRVQTCPNRLLSCRREKPSEKTKAKKKQQALRREIFGFVLLSWSNVKRFYYEIGRIFPTPTVGALPEKHKRAGREARAGLSVISPCLAGLKTAPRASSFHGCLPDNMCRHAHTCACSQAHKGKKRELFLFVWCGYGNHLQIKITA